MIKRKSIVIAAIALIFGVFVSCAKTSPGVTQGMDIETFEAWIHKYAPLATKIEGGVYLEFKERSPYWESMTAPKVDTSWLQLNMTCYTMSGTVIGTRNADVARLIGLWSYTTHFVPNILKYKYENYGVICQGLVVALQKMRAGDKARVYIPSKWMLSSGTFTTGYAAIENYIDYPVYYDIELVEVINNPSQWEDYIAYQYAGAKWGISRRDTIATGLYMRKLVSNPTGNAITTDSTVRLFEVLRFLDGQLLSTNIDSVATADHYKGLNQTNKSYSVLEINKSKFESEYSQKNLIYRKILPLLRTGEQAEVVATSNWGEGNEGLIDNVPQIGAYEPIHYHFRILNPSDSDK